MRPWVGFSLEGPVWGVYGVLIGFSEVVATARTAGRSLGCLSHSFQAQDWPAVQKSKRFPDVWVRKASLGQITILRQPFEFRQEKDPAEMMTLWLISGTSGKIGP